MNKNTRLIAVALVAAIALAVLLLQPRARVPLPPSATATATAGQPAAKTDVFLTRLPILGGEHACIAHAGEPLAIIRAERTAAGAVFLLVQAAPACRGWVPAALVANSDH